MKQAYERKKWGFVSDYMRLDIIYKYGGIYLDTDIEMIKKPDQLLYQECFGCVDSSMTMNLGSGFGAIPKTKSYENSEIIMMESHLLKKMVPKIILLVIVIHIMF